MGAWATYPDLDQKVPEMFLEGGDVLVQVEHALHHDLDLVVREVGEGGAQQRRRELLDVEHVVGGGAQLAVDTPRLHLATNCLLEPARPRPPAHSTDQ